MSARRPYLLHQQRRVVRWMERAFGVTTARERARRFLEEALELAQLLLTEQEANELVRYVYGRPPGKLRQEVGGVMVTLLGLCGNQSVSAEQCLEDELKRIESPDVMERCRVKQNEKHRAGLGDEVREKEDLTPAKAWSP